MEQYEILDLEYELQGALERDYVAETFGTECSQDSRFCSAIAQFKRTQPGWEYSGSGKRISGYLEQNPYRYSVDDLVFATGWGQTGLKDALLEAQRHAPSQEDFMNAVASIGRFLSPASN